MFKGIYGGRGSGKSHFCALYCIIKALEKSRTRIACLRTIDCKNDESALALIKDYIYKLKIQHLVNISKSLRKIEFFNGSEIMFFGANQSNHENFKSTEGISVCWLDEASLFSEEIITTIVPTIRTEGAEVLFSWNPKTDYDPCYTFLKKQEEQNGSVFMLKANYYNNPFASNNLIEMAKIDKKANYENYLHVWEGFPAKISEQLIYGSLLKVFEFDSPSINEIDYIIGVDWGHTNYSACIRAFIQNNQLYVDYESYKKQLAPRDLKQFFDLIPYSRLLRIIADCNNPLMVSESAQLGYNIEACEKNTNDLRGVIDGINVIKSLDAINIHPRCVHLIEEMRLYRWKKERGFIVPKIIKENDHGVDALRYACQDFIKHKIKSQLFIDSESFFASN